MASTCRGVGIGAGSASLAMKASLECSPVIRLSMAEMWVLMACSFLFPRFGRVALLGTVSASTVLTDLGVDYYVRVGGMLSVRIDLPGDGQGLDFCD